MNVLRILPALAFSSLFLSHCRGDRPEIQGGNSSQLSDVAIGDLDKPSWSKFDLKLERLEPTLETINRSYQKAGNQAGNGDTSVLVPYGSYKILLVYYDAQDQTLYESCSDEKSKEHQIRQARYRVEIKICGAGSKTPVGVVPAEEADVHIKPVVVPPSGGSSFAEQLGLLPPANGTIGDKYQALSIRKFSS